MSAIRKTSERMAETAELLDRAVNVALVAVGLVAAIAYVLVLFVAFNGDESDRGGDIIVLPAQPF